MEICGWEYHREEMEGKALKGTLELCQEIYRNRIDKAKVKVTQLKSK